MKKNLNTIFAAAFLGLALPLGAAPIVLDDDADRDFAVGPNVTTFQFSTDHNNGGWGSGAQYFNQTNAYNGGAVAPHNGGTPGAATATYVLDTTMGVVAGETYNVYATWAQNGQGNTGPATYTVSDGLGAVVVDQTLAVDPDLQVADSFVGDNKNFELLGQIVEDGDGIITIVLSSDGSNFVLADAVAVDVPPLHWDGTDIDGDANGGAGTWDVATTANWDDLAIGGADLTWAQSSSAVFGGASGGTVTLAEPITANSLTFNLAGYDISGNTLTIEESLAVNEDTTISSALAGSLPVSKAGAGALTLTGDGSGFTDTLTIGAGRFNLDVATSLGGSVVVSDGGAIGGEGTITGDLQLGSIFGTGSTLGVDPATGTALNVTNLTLEAPTTLSFDSAPASGVAIPIITYSGILADNNGGTLEDAFNITGRASIVDNAQTIEVTLGNSETSTWNDAAATGFWSHGDVLLDGNWTSVDTYFFSGDTVTFDDTAPGLVELDESEGTLEPASVTFSNTFGNDYTITGSPIRGAGGVTVGGTGTVLFDGENAYTGGTTVNYGVLELNEVGGIDGIGAVRGEVTVNGPGVLRLSSGNALGWGGGVKVNTLNVFDGGLVDNTAIGDNGWNIAINLRGSTLQSAGAGSLFSLGGGSTVTSLASADTSVIAGEIRLREGNLDNRLPFTVEDGAAATDLLVSALLVQQNGGGGITKSGPGTMSLTGLNTYPGATVVNDGVLAVNGTALDDTSSLVLDGGTVDVTGTEVVDSLLFGAVLQAPGTWGALGNVTADHTSALITGGGLLDVTTGAATAVTVTSISWAGSMATIEFAGGNADVYSSENLLAPWTQIGTDVAPTTFTDNAATELKKFYAVVPTGTVFP